MQPGKALYTTLREFVENALDVSVRASRGLALVQARRARVLTVVDLNFDLRPPTLFHSLQAAESVSRLPDISISM